MKELFGLSMNYIMLSLLAVFVICLSVVVVLALRNRVMFNLGIRPISRRPGQTVLILFGVMLSTVIISAAFGTGDTLSVSIREDVFRSLKTVDEVIVPARMKQGDAFGSNPFVPYERFETLQNDLANLDSIDGLTPQLAMVSPVVNPRTELNEGFMNLVGVDPQLLQGFIPMKLRSGQHAVFSNLGDDDVYINEAASKELEARANDTLTIYVEGAKVNVNVRGVIENGGLAGRDPTIMILLPRLQDIFDRSGQINSIVVSNRGNIEEGLLHSAEVTKVLRVLFHDREIALRLKELLNNDSVLSAIKTEEKGLSESLKADVSKFQVELSKDELSEELNSLLADTEVVRIIRKSLSRSEVKDVEKEVLTLFEELSEFRVIEFKKNLVDIADTAGSVVTTFFLVMSLFSIAVGILLIFLIFIMLAAARRPEMGMARAVGAKRNHLVQMFTYEGTAYALVAAGVGVGLGLGVSAAMVEIMNRIFVTFGENFSMSVHFELRTIVVSYCMGMVITFATVAGSAYRVSRLNIVAAVRNLPEPIEITSTSNLAQRLVGLAWALIRPIVLIWRGVRALLNLQLRQFFGYTFVGLIWFPVLWSADVSVALIRFAWPYLIAGWLTILIGASITAWGIFGIERLSVYTGGVSLIIVGAGLLLRYLGTHGMRMEVFGGLIFLGGAALLPYVVVLADILAIIVTIPLIAVGFAMVLPFILRRVHGSHSDTLDRLTATFIGVVMLAFWTMPSGPFPDFIEKLEGNFDMMFVSGLFMVGAAVWTLMYNTDLLLKGVALLTGRLGSTRPALVIAIAYPLSNKVRTGLTLAMFALVVFTLMVMSVLTNIFTTQFNDPAEVLGGWQIDGRINAATPIDDVRRGIIDQPDLNIEDFSAIGGLTSVDMQARQLDAKKQEWIGTSLFAADEGYLDSTGFKFKIIADGYGENAREVWQSIKENPNLAVVGGYLLNADENDRGNGEFDSILQDVYYKDESMPPVQLEVRDPNTREIFTLTVIGVMDRLHRSAGSIYVSKEILDNLAPFQIPITDYRFRLNPGVDALAVSKSLESTFFVNGMDSVVAAQELEKEAEAGRTFGRLFTGFMALGLLVGIAALGVVSTRAVVERRQQIGVLRAIGYRRKMIQISFLLESSFVSLLGTFIGTTLGIVLAWQAFDGIRQGEGVDSLKFSVPWVQICVILVATYGFSLAATLIPARQASKTYPAEALRYE